MEKRGKKIPRGKIEGKREKKDINLPEKKRFKLHQEEHDDESFAIVCSEGKLQWVHTV